MAILFGLAACSTPSTKDQSSRPVKATGSQELKLEDLLTSQLEGVEGTEVVVSRVTIPPHTSLPKHWHPGEEFAYVLEGSAVLWQEGKADVIGKKGDVVKVPLKQIHTAITTEEGATILVFRVHELGKPQRTIVE
ncbi:cupin domain-containing protein [candidate division KSB1 bacterium]|nr:cupin domain-containing protein [candidate division KSB1 bacterium]NIV70738.1 cupin domain-containing protein [Phycisphaerae bacterium]NIR73399.1 cupin domain-containing protein [candidate division KSB1 bacterium]NIS23940.1 cupin domain-containing protein [candidate division KSB1 bacterium]NIT70857.1 cupin domain-containing protein [candidate division KSB1 bacterium]